jgi:hypothetical protein
MGNRRHGKASVFAMIFSRRAARRVRNERGQAATELIVILPVFLALVFGLIELGKGFSYWVDMTHLAGESGRYASVSWFPGCPSDSTVTGPCSGATLQSYTVGASDLEELAKSSNPSSPQDPGCLLTPQQPSGTIKGEVPCKLAVSYCYPPQGTGIIAGNPGSSLRVDITSTYRLSLVKAAFSLFPGGSSLGDVHLKAHSTIRLERKVDPTRLGVVSISPCT